MKSASPTFLWHDYETWGVNPATDRASQFAAIRTTMDLQEVGKPINDFCQVPLDYLPNPEAMLVTKITPQKANQEGYAEAQFAKRVAGYMMEPETCVVGYNSIRFDDEVSRHLFYRNFIEPYGREYLNGNSRWDIIDLVRACYALRPEGIVWPTREDGLTSFRLEELTKANGIGHEQAHDALSDVRATIAFAKLIKDKQPKLFDFAFSLRKKEKVLEHIDVLNLTPVVHVSGMISPAHGCISMMVPIAYHPSNKNAVIMVDLHHDVTPLLELSTDEIIERLYTRRSVLSEEGKLPVGLKLIHVNKSPFIAPAKMLTEELAASHNIDLAFAREQYKLLKQNQHIRDKVTDVYHINREYDDNKDVDNMLYDGFFSNGDKAKMEAVLNSNPEQLGIIDWQFEDARLTRMLFRYRARNFPHTLNEQEQFKWQQHCLARLQDTDYAVNLESLFMKHQSNPENLALLNQLNGYLQSL